ncbi:hypothetical protein CN151_12435 [Sinorhizobium meliloti]|nr:hypothetical protein C770_GR4pD0965 [Sinorhizobium meliloti GR4]RVL04601.1 hypothetical protein CN151_12435 [Sinorhizobium meliloti]RVM83123.1 hypothetical protein CN119_33450 [Sinorhizobium meliloti]RVN10338.1 hypothetical protein CN112_12635 [Sinorhizobium meliloti]
MPTDQAATTCGRSTEKSECGSGPRAKCYGINRLSAGMLVKIFQSLKVSPMEILGAYFQHERPSGSRMDWLQEKLLTAERKLSGVRRALRDE